MDRLFSARSVGLLYYKAHIALVLLLLISSLILLRLWSSDPLWVGHCGKSRGKYQATTTIIIVSAVCGGCKVVVVFCRTQELVGRWGNHNLYTLVRYTVLLVLVVLLASQFECTTRELRVVSVCVCVCVLWWLQIVVKQHFNKAPNAAINNGLAPHSIV